MCAFDVLKKNKFRRKYFNVCTTELSPATDNFINTRRATSSSVVVSHENNAFQAIFSGPIQSFCVLENKTYNVIGNMHQPRVTIISYIISSPLYLGYLYLINISQL